MSKTEFERGQISNWILEASVPVRINAWHLARAHSQDQLFLVVAAQTLGLLERLMDVAAVSPTPVFERHDESALILAQYRFFLCLEELLVQATEEAPYIQGHYLTPLDPQSSPAHTELHRA